MGSPKLTATDDGRITSVAYTTDTKLPPMMLVAVNDALADVPPEASWPNKTEYKFTHVVPRDEMLTGGFIKHVLQWMAGRLDAGGGSLDPGATGPMHGFLKEAWKSQEPIINDWAEAPDGEEEQWAQLYSELFSGINYNGTGEGYGMGEGAGRNWDEYIYSRLQSKYQEHGTYLDDKRKDDYKQPLKVGRSIVSWEEPKLRIIAKADAAGREWKDNTDPASPLCCACQYLAAYGLITRGFRIEYAKRELQATLGVVGLSAAPADGMPVFASPGAWFWRDEKAVTNVATMLKETPALGPGTVYTFHTYHQLANFPISVKILKGSTDRTKEIQGRIEKETTFLRDKVKAVVAAIETEEKAKFEAAKAAGTTPAPELVSLNATFTGQPKGSHIMQVLRIHKDKTRVQLFDANGGNFSRGAMDAERDAQGRSLGRGLVLEAGLGSNLDTSALSTIYSNPNGCGIPKPAPDLAAQIETMKKARPIGLARLVLTERFPTADLTVEHVLYVSKLLRTYGDAEHQNYSIARYLWALRNTPGFSSIQPWWFIFLPRGVLARGMWAVGSRAMKLGDFLAKHEKSSKPDSDWFRFPDGGGYAIDYNYSESQVLTNVADADFPGRSKIIRRVKSEPVFPNGARLVEEGMTRLPAAFTQALPGVAGPRNVILPPATMKTVTDGGKKHEVISREGHRILAWDAVYVRADITDADGLRTLTDPLLDYYRTG